MSKILDYVLPVAAIALPFAFPATMAALGTILGAGVGSAGMVGSGLTGALMSGVGSAVSGNSPLESLKNAALGGAGGALGAGGGNALAEGAGLTGTSADIAGGAMSGAAYGGQGGGESALSGALMGGVSGGMFGGSEPSGLTGSEAMTGVSSTGAPYTTTANLQGLTTGTGLAAGGSKGMNLVDALKLGGTVYSGISSQDAYDEMQKQLNASLSPYTTAGATATGQLSDALTKGFNYSDYQDTPSYNFQLEQGQNALTNALTSQGMGQSGAAVKEATNYATNFANQNYNDAYNQWLQKNQQLAGLSGTGYGAASNLGTNSALLTGAGQNSINEMVSGASNNPLIAALLKKTGLFA